MALDFAPHDLSSATSRTPYEINASSDDASFGRKYRAFDGSTNRWYGNSFAGAEWLEINLDTTKGIHRMAVAATTQSSSYSGSNNADKTVDDYPGSVWIGTGGGVDWVRYDLGSGVTKIVVKYSIQSSSTASDNRAPKNWTLEGSNDASSWTTVDTVTNATAWGACETRWYTCDLVTTAYRYYRVNISANNGDATYTQINQVNLYVDDGGAPIKHVLSSYRIKCTASEPTRAPKNWKMQGSNDAQNWDDLDTVTNETGWNTVDTRDYGCDVVATAYQYFRLKISANNGDGTYTQVEELYLYAPLSDFAPHDLTTATSHSPYAVNASSDNSFGYKHKAFDGGTDSWIADQFAGAEWLQLNLDVTKGVHRMAISATTQSSSYSGSNNADKLIDDAPGTSWIGTGSGVDWVRYDFGSGVTKIVTKYSIQASNVNRSPKNWTLEGSNDASSWSTVDTVTNSTGWAVNEVRWFTCDTTTTAYRYYRLNITANNGDATYTQFTQMDLYVDDGAGAVTKILHSYKMKCTAGVSTRAPKDWKIQGSNDAQNWTDLDTRSNETGWGSVDTRYYQCANPVDAYQYFRIKTTANNGDGTYTQIEELYLYEDERRALTGPAGITSGEAFSAGTISTTSSDQNLSGTAGIASGETFSAGVFTWDLFLTGSSGIASAEAFSAGSIAIVSPMVGDEGIPSAEAFEVGLFSLALVSTSGIASAEAFEVGIIAGSILGVSGIASAEAFPVGALVENALDGVTGIASAEAFGTDGAFGYADGPIEGLTGIVSAETFPAGIIAGPITGTSGITSAEAFSAGEFVIRLIGVTGIPSAEAFGTGGALTRSIVGLESIESEERFGMSGVLLTFAPGLDNVGVSNFAIYIAGNLRTQYVKSDSIRIDEQVSFQNSATLELIESEMVFTPRRGEEVIVYYYDEDITPDKPGDDNWHRIFAGTIETMDILGEYVSDPTRNIVLNCTDYGRALSKRLLNKVFTETEFGTLTKIMTYLNDGIFKEEGITWVSKGDPGITIGDIEFNYTPLNEVMDKLAEIVGWDWATDYYRNIYIYDRPAELVSAPFSINQSTTGADAYMWKNLKVSHSRGLFRNRQYVRSEVAKGEDGGELRPPDSPPTPGKPPTIGLKKTYTMGTWKVNPTALISLRRPAWDTSQVYFPDELSYIPDGHGGWTPVTRAGLPLNTVVPNAMGVGGVIACTQEDATIFAFSAPINSAPRIVDETPYADDGYDISSPWHGGGRITSLKVNGVSKVVAGLDGRNPTTGDFDADWMCPTNQQYEYVSNALHYSSWFGEEFQIGSNGGRALVVYYIGKLRDPLNQSKVHLKFGDTVEITWVTISGSTSDTYTHTYTVDVPRTSGGDIDIFYQYGANATRVQGHEERQALGAANGIFYTTQYGAQILDENVKGTVYGVLKVTRNGVEETVGVSSLPGVYYYSGANNPDWLWLAGKNRLVSRRQWTGNRWANNQRAIAESLGLASSMVGHDVSYPLPAIVDKEPRWGDVIEVEWEVEDTTGGTTTKDEIPDDQPDTPGTDDPVTIPAIGIWESVDDLPGVTDPELVKQYAASLLKKFSVPGVEVDFETLRYGLVPGQETTVNLPKYAVTNMVAKVESITKIEEGMRVLRQQVKVANTIQGRDAFSAFNRLVKKLNRPERYQKSTITFHLAETISGIPNPGLVVGENLTAGFIARRNITLIDGVVYFKTAPTGAPIQMDIKVDGVSIFPVGHGVVYPADSTALKAFSLFRTNPLTIKKNSVVTIDVISTGSEQPGKDGTLVLTGWV